MGAGKLLCMKSVSVAMVAVLAVGVACAGAQTTAGSSGSSGIEASGGLAGLLTISRARAMELGSEDTQRFYAGESAELWLAMSARMMAALKNEASLQNFAKQIRDQYGTESAVLHEDAMPAPPKYVLYTRIVKFSKSPAPMVVTFTFSGAGTIEGFFVRPEPNPARSDYLNYQDKTRLTWPLKGAWTVYQGGRTVAENYHAAYPDERFAYDVVVLDPAGQMYAEDGARNEEWFGFGRPVVADADGTVVKAIDQYEDNEPNHPSETNPRYGNTVVIDHGDGEFSMYAHLKRGSVAVKAGEKVKPGQPIAMVGDSGDAPFPQLDYHLQTTGEWFKGQGLPTVFNHVRLNGKRVDEAEPVRGDTVERR
jgi:hypothetical protein